MDVSTILARLNAAGIRPVARATAAPSAATLADLTDAERDNVTLLSEAVNSGIINGEKSREWPVPNGTFSDVKVASAVLKSLCGAIIRKHKNSDSYFVSVPKKARKAA